MARFSTIFVGTLVAALFAPLAVAAKKPREAPKRDWQPGKVLDSKRSSYFAGTSGDSTSQTALYRVYQTFLIEGETHAYLAQERLRWRWSEPANLTVNGSVRFAVEKQRLFVIDEDGDEHEMEIVKRILRLPTERSGPPKP